MEKIVTKNIFDKLMSKLPFFWDGKTSIIYMKENGCRDWKQMEWAGWYFQFMCNQILKENHFFEIPGKKYGKVEFDGFKDIPYDFKAHADESGELVPTNGYQEVCFALEDYGEVGFIIARGSVEYDDEDQTFKKWHDQLKGKKTKYEIDREFRGKNSRPRKISFSLKQIVFVFVTDETLQYTKKFQEGMRNSNGTPRNSKVIINLNNEKLEMHTYEVEE
jgi:hypothetical protein